MVANVKMTRFFYYFCFLRMYNVTPPANEARSRKITGYNGAVSPVFGDAALELSVCVGAGSTLTGSAVDGCSVDGCSVDGCSVDGCSVDGCSVDGCSVVGCSVDGCSVDGSSVVGSVIFFTSEIIRTTVIFVLLNEAGPFVSYEYRTPLYPTGWG